ncbi:MAG: hypothetical protein AAF411_16350, partial [Myxococcota bacterium]
DVALDVQLDPDADIDMSTDAGPDAVVDAELDAVVDAEPDAPAVDPDTLRVFVTSTAFSGSLGGVEGADERCANAAGVFELERDGARFIAWVSTADDDAVDRMPDEGSWRLLDEEAGVAFMSAAQLRTSPNLPIDVTEAGMRLDTATVWTGTADSGAASTRDCTGWTSADADGRGTYGAIDSTANWTDRGLLDPCNDTKHLYCFEVPES